MKPSNQIVGANHARRANAVMERLTALQNRGRLGIHVVEQYGAFIHHDKKTIGHLDEVAPEAIPQKLREYQSADIATHPPLFSMSLLPAAQSDWSMATYATLDGEINNYAYLFDLSQEGPHAPRIIRADPHDLVSGFDFHNKRIGFDRNKNLQFAAFYREISCTDEKSSPSLIEESVIHAIGGVDGAKHSNTQLDMLAHIPMHERYRVNSMLEDVPPDAFGENIAPWNEMLVAASRSHISAIALPIFERLDGRKPYCLDQRKLQAALIGMDHLDHGFNLPVVLYHVSAPNQGKLTFVGQTQQELTLAALQALKTISDTKTISDGKNNILDLPISRIETANSTIQHHLGIDLSLPANGPEGWKAQVDTKLAALQAPSRLKADREPAQPPRRT